MDLLRSRLERLDASIRFETRGDLAPYVHWKNNSEAPIHRWLKYREAYSPDLIDRLALGRRILDPFSGCGSILVGGATRRKSALGIDLNPLATFSTRVKLTSLNERQLRKAARFLKVLPSVAFADDQWPLPALSIAEKVFEPDILDAILRIRTAIHFYCENDETLENFLVLAWLSILEAVGSYFKEGNGIKYRNKQRREGRYEERRDGEWQLHRFGVDQRSFVLKTFALQLSKMLHDTHLWKNGDWSGQKVVSGSAFDMTQIVGRRRFDSVIFSPPYANRFDYFESFKVELWFGGFSKSYDDLSRLRKQSMRSHLGADMQKPAGSIDYLEEFIQLMDTEASSWKMGVPQLLRGYFHDLQLVLKQSREVCPQGKCFVVIGNSAFAGIVIPTDALTAVLGKLAGFSRATVLTTRHLTVAPQQRRVLSGFERYMRESIVVLE